MAAHSVCPPRPVLFGVLHGICSSGRESAHFISPAGKRCVPSPRGIKIPFRLDFRIRHIPRGEPLTHRTPKPAGTSRPARERASVLECGGWPREITVRLSPTRSQSPTSRSWRGAGLTLLSLGPPSRVFYTRKRAHDPRQIGAVRFIADRRLFQNPHPLRAAGLQAPRKEPDSCRPRAPTR